VLCNQVPAGKKYGKGVRFPVIGRHAVNPGEEANERPLLLNPCVDDPGKHLGIDSTGILIPKTDRGQVTIEVLGLNERDLPQERSEAYETTLMKFNTIIASGGANRAQKLTELRDDVRQSFSSTRRAAFNKALTELLADLPT
jgi:hypothetical protein